MLVFDVLCHYSFVDSWSCSFPLVLGTDWFWVSCVIAGRFVSHNSVHQVTVKQNMRATVSWQLVLIPTFPSPTHPPTSPTTSPSLCIRAGTVRVSDHLSSDCQRKVHGSTPVRSVFAYWTLFSRTGPFCVLDLLIYFCMPRVNRQRSLATVLSIAGHSKATVHWQYQWPDG